MAVDDDFLLGKPKSQRMTCGQELTTAMVAGRCFSNEGINIQVNIMVTHSGSTLETALHDGALVFFRGGREVQGRRVRPREILVRGGGARPS